MSTVFSIIPFIFIISSICFTYIEYKKSKTTIETNDENKIVDFIWTGINIILRKFYKSGISILVIFIVFLLLIKNNSEIIKSEIILIIITTSVCGLTSFLCTKFSIGSIKSILKESESLNNCYQKIQKNGYFVAVSLIGIILIDLLVWLILLEILINNNILYISEIIAQLFDMNWSASLKNNPLYINKTYFLICLVLSSHILGSNLHSLLSNLSFFNFAVGADTSADITGYTNYDLHENDLKNAGSITDQVGDQLKYSYLVFANTYAILMIILLSVILFGAAIGVQDPIKNSFKFIIFPFIYISMALFFMTFVNIKFKSKINSEYDIFKEKWIKQIKLVCILLLITTVLAVFKLINEHVYIANTVGLISGLFILPFFYYLSSLNSKPIKMIVESCKTSILTTLSTGFYISFLATFIISIFTSITIWIGFSITGEKFELFNNLYHIGIIGINILIVSLNIIPNAFSSGMVDNASDISEMLIFDKEKSENLRTLNSTSNSMLLHLNSIYSLILIYSISLIIFFFLLKLTYVAYELNLEPTTTIEGLNITKQHLLTLNIDFNQIINQFNINFLNPKFIIGIILGFGTIFGISSFATYSLFKSYKIASETINNEFKTKPNIWNATELPNYNILIEKLSNYSIKVMPVGIFALVTFTSIVWILIDIAGTIGFLLSMTISGVLLSQFFYICGTLWSNAKINLEVIKNEFGTSNHASSFMTDKLGDIFKNSLAPLNIEIIKFSLLFSLILCGVIVTFNWGV